MNDAAIGFYQGGIHPQSHKHLASESPIRTDFKPTRLKLLLKQHPGNPAKPLVEVGDRVKAGQPIAAGDGRFSAPIHAPCAGEVTALEDNAILLKVSEDDSTSPYESDKWDPAHFDRDALIDWIAQCGIVGMGGAMFPTADKLKLSKQFDIHTLVINGGECEPYLSCDDRLMREQASKIIGGIRYLLQATGAPRAVIGVEDNKPLAIERLRQAIEPGEPIVVMTMPARYPMGSEKQMLETLFGIQVPSGKLTAALGYLVQNVATCFAVFEAVRFKRPLTHRVVTVSGEAIEQPANVLAPIGSLMSDLVAYCGGLKVRPKRIVNGGPMMGKPVASIHTPVTKGTSGILLLTETETGSDTPSGPCVRCSRCVQVCPMGLQPLEIAAKLKRDALDEAVELGLADCLACGCCSYQCAASLPLVELFQWGKQQLALQRYAEQKSQRTKLSREQRTERLAREAEAKKAAKANKRRPRSRSSDAEASKEES